MPRYNNRHALILGAGKSGIAAAKLILHVNGKATIIDRTWDEEQRHACESVGIKCLTVSDDAFPEGDFDLVITSPGLPATHPWFLTARDSGYSIISELELASHFWRGETWGITGSKGKSSVVKCLVDTLNQNQFTAVAAGNYGTPLSAYVLSLPNAGEGVIAVTEVSSFQLEFTRTFAPRFAAILNLQPDHLDRHKTMENYLNIKRKIFQAQSSEKGCKAFLPWGINPLGIPQGVPLERFGSEVWIDWRYTAHSVVSKTTTVPLKGYFDNTVLGNAAALITAILTAHGLSPEAIARGFETFEPLPHRVQFIGEKNGVRFIDDSKGTSLSATQAALKMCGPKVHLIAGGLLKEDDLDFLEDELDLYAKAAYIIGKETTPLLSAWAPILPTHDCKTMETAVREAFRAAKPGDTILLSPGAASFDQYSGMAARGEDFKRCMDLCEG
jgi:UDP-N-acetylmuramoylalanine--D-glutamate ligase